MNITFLGGTGTVTGSKFLVSLDGGKTEFLVDCGMFQGYKWLRERNWETPMFDYRRLSGIVLTHAHLDHSGYIPRLYQLGYRGPVYCHHATRDLCSILLPDSGHIQEEDARFYQRHKIGKHAHPEPLYNGDTAERSLELFQSVDFDEPIRIGGASLYLQPAGHILGAGSAVLSAEGKRVGFSGDVGRPDDLIMHPPRPLPALDLLLLESTYGDRRHPQVDHWQQLADIVNEVVNRGGILLIPSFAVGRAQTLQYLLLNLMRDQRIPQLPVFLDSPMAIDASEIYTRYPDQHRLNTDTCKFMCTGIQYTRDVEQSKALENIQYPHIIIAGSGMATGGRVLHHMKRLLPDHRATVLFTGYQAGGTRGARLLAGAQSVKIHGEYVPCKAHIEVLEGLSAHADYRELGDWLKQSALEAGTEIQLVHGEPDASDCFRLYLQDNTNFNVKVAQYRDILRL
ncbi:MBL fold metallo-hydrolase RNA specificity domain-containing protein [Microbulbifer hydrolyticus]|uniref:MBL fold metallo-hydrolase n=1 Tax=Microbulbifer hydrolyticus TaxID=48074 RepID=A0A6P1T9Y9_9GAMM|nr:MBL fold metallo-hydrolase [Microbulbifer hydrolyticus]MBB5213156.1 metallo-beta-lactamase family protein [Microbulbifer hydrolyticus]QHQ38641.1 MBL fold metallo-hydrolase [Microbulbifer hydrolyticus]